MALVQPDLPTPAGITLRAIQALGQEDDVLPAILVVPVVDEDKPNTIVKQVKVWTDVIPAVDQGDEAARWLSSWLQTDGLRLVRISKSAHRVTDPNFGIGETAFSDGFPILVSSVASIEEVARRVRGEGGPKISIDRFRPNIHIEGCGPFAEDEIRSLSFGSEQVTLRLVKPCSRCSMPGVDPSTGIRNTQTGGTLLRSLRSFRQGSILRAKAFLHASHFAEQDNAEETFFGQNALIEFGPDALKTQAVTISVGEVGMVEWA